MEFSKTKVAWFIISALASILSGYYAFIDPIRFYSAVDLFATVTAILVGLLLAIIALVSAAPTISESFTKSAAERKRIEAIVKESDLGILIAQNFTFWVYYLSIIFAFSFKFYAYGITSENLDEGGFFVIRSLSSCFGFLATFALLWSATLPSLMRSIIKQRSDLSSG